MKKLSLMLALALLLSCCAGLGALAEEETIRLTWMYPLGQGFEVVDSMAENATILRANAANHVEIEFRHPPVGQETEQYNLMLASGELPDIITHGWGIPESYPGGADQAIADEYFLDLTELIREYAPNYQAILDSNEVVRKAVTTDSGAVWNMCMVDTTPQGEWTGPVIRKDMWDRYGLEVPVTLDDWHDCLTVIKEKAPADYPEFKAPLMVYNKGFGTEFNQFLGAFDVDDTFCLNADGEIVYGPIQDGYRAFLETMRQWYAEGLIQTDFAADDNDFATEFLNDQCAAAQAIGYWLFDGWKATSENPDFELLGVAVPRLTEDSVPHISYTATQARGYATVITAECAHPERAVAYLDWFYSPEGSALANWGVEGEDYTVSEDGAKVYTDKIAQNEEGVPIATIYFKYLFSHGAFLREWDRENSAYGPEALAALDVWADSADDAYMLPLTLSYTDEESSAYTAIMSDVTVYVNESSIKFINGDRSMDEWDAYVEQIERMRIGEATEIAAAAYGRWAER